MKIKSVSTPESDRVKGYRRMIEETGREHGLLTNSRSLDEVCGSSTMPTRTMLECTPGREARGRQKNFPGGLSVPCNFKVTRRKASADEMHEAARHSPEVGGYGYVRDVTLKHRAFTSNRDRREEEE